MSNTTVYEVASRLKDQFKIDMGIDQVISNSALAMKLIRRYVLERKKIFVQVENFEACLNCGVIDVKSVIRSNPPSYFKVEEGILHPNFIFFKDSIVTSDVVDETLLCNDNCPQTNFVDSFKYTNANPYIDFVWDSPYIRLNECNVGIAVEATVIKLDEEGYPVIPEDCLEGCVYYCLYVYYQPLFLMEQVSPTVFAQIERWKNDKINQSRPFRLDRAAADRVFNVLVSMDRKRFGIPS